ncbi:MAG: DUF5343 domain-containing protein [Telmatospirillum sp.]|nr:DUF5343 domain-containing protein [Telmatospirillum sp.]
MVDIPYLITNRRLPDLLSKIQSAAVPERVSFEYLKKLGFASSNDRALPSLLKKLGFLDQSGVPTERYKAYRNKTEGMRILSQGVRELYAEVFSVDENAHKLSEDKVKGIISRISGEDDRTVKMMTKTFTALCGLSSFDLHEEAGKKVETQATKSSQGQAEQESAPSLPVGRGSGAGVSLRYNIEIHLPATSDVSVYNAIFRSIREHLGE